MVMWGVDKAKIQSDPALKKKLEAQLTKAIAEEAGVAEQEVNVYLFASSARRLQQASGGMKVSFNISPEDIKVVKQIEKHFEHSKTLGDTVKDKIEEDSSLKAVCVGSIRVSSIEKPVVHIPRAKVVTTTTAMAVVETSSASPVETTTTTTGRPATTLPPLPPPAAGPQPVEVRIKPGWAAGQCMDISGGLAKPGNAIQAWTCTDSRDMQFLMDVYKQAGHTRIRWKTFPEYCFNAPGGTQLMLWPCDKSTEANIMFEVPVEGSGMIRMANRPNDCITLPTGKAGNGEWFQISPCDQIHANEKLFSIEFVDCDWEEWSEWSSCSAKCGGGERLRRARGSGDLLTAPETGRCAGEVKQSMPCNRQSCAAPPSSKELLIAPLAARLRYSLNPSICLSVGNSVTFMTCADSAMMMWMLPADGVGPVRWREQSQQCLDSPGEDKVQMWDCNKSPADHVNFTISATGTAAICLAKDPGRCLVAPPGGVGQEVSIEPCGTPGRRPCATFEAQFVDCDWGKWDEWSECSVKCGGGTKARHRRHTELTIPSCVPDVEEDHVAPCNTQPCQ
mmetsp:Transcript_77913/g.252659  ORF Transcript_77913/g.252659 Transcript_77913/m.252659 type:complete len:562 (-) Transcript_77913:61-1746(-)